MPEMRAMADIGNELWDWFIQESSSAWFTHTSTWIDFIMHMEKPVTSINRSFGVFDSNRMIAAVPLVEKDIHNERGLRGLSFSSFNTPYPVFSNKLSVAKIKKAEKYIFSKIMESQGVDYINYYVCPLTAEILQKKTIINPLCKFGFHDTSISTNIVLFEGDENKLFSRVRKGHKADIKKGEKSGYLIEIIGADKISEKLFNVYRQLHFKAAGKQTRPDATWDMMKDWIKKGFSMLALCKKGDTYISAALVNTFKQKAYYQSGATLPGCENERGIGHLMQWEIIKYLNNKAFTHYELGCNYYPNISQEVADQKLLGISRFKAGFGGVKYPLFRGEYFFNINYMEQIYIDRLNACRETI